MLFLLFGSSAAGKTFVLNALRGRVADLAIYDFDEIGVPPGADTAWRHRADEQWLHRALEYHSLGTDLLLAGQTPFGELLATPSASRLEAISACLIDCEEDTRASRGLKRVAPSGSRGQQETLRTPSTGPSGCADTSPIHRWRRDVIRHNATEKEMHWARLSGWRPRDPRWRVRVIDTSDLPVEEVGARLVKWISEERALLRSGTPLPGTAIWSR